MGTIRSHRLAAGTATGTGQHTLYTCPAATTVLVKSAIVKNGSGSSAVYAIGGVVVGTATNIDWFARAAGSPLANGQSDALLGWFCLEAGDVIFMYIVSGGPLLYWLSGTVLT